MQIEKRQLAKEEKQEKQKSVKTTCTSLAGDVSGEWRNTSRFRRQMLLGIMQMVEGKQPSTN